MRLYLGENKAVSSSFHYMWLPGGLRSVDRRAQEVDFGYRRYSYTSVRVCMYKFSGRIPKKQGPGEWEQDAGGRRRQLPFTSYHSGLLQCVACTCVFIVNRFLKVVLVLTFKDERSHQNRTHSCANVFASLGHLAYLKVCRK